MAEIGMVMLRDAAAEADRARQPDQQAQPGPQDIYAPEQPEPASCPLPAARAPGPALLFTRISRAILDTIALETRIIANLKAELRDAPPTPPDRRRAKLRSALYHLVADHPRRVELEREADDKLDRELAADPEATFNIPELFVAICRDLEIEIDYDNLPTAMFGMGLGGPDPPKERVLF